MKPRSILAYYTNKDYIKSYRYSPNFIVIKPIYYKKDLELLKRFLKAIERCDLHIKTNCPRTDKEERNRLNRRKRALRNLYKLRAMCHRRGLFSGPYGGKGVFKLIW